MLDEKDLQAIAQLLDTKIRESESRMLAERHQFLQQTLSPKERLDALEDEISFMKQVIKSMSHDIEALEKAQ